MEQQALSSVDQNVAQPIVYRSSVEESERNFSPGSQHGNRTPSMRDLPESRRERAVPQDKAGNAARTPTSTRKSFELELLELLKALREKNIQGNCSTPQYGAASFAQPHTNPTPDASHGTLPLRPEYKIPSASVTKVYHHYHYHYNSPSISPPPIINKNIVRINNKNTTNGSDSSESGDDEGEY
jgi:hypothetical protein